MPTFFTTTRQRQPGAQLSFTQDVPVVNLDQVESVWFQEGACSNEPHAVRFVLASGTVVLFRFQSLGNAKACFLWAVTEELANTFEVDAEEPLWS